MTPFPVDGRSEIIDRVKLEFSGNPPHLPSSISHLRTNFNFNFNKSASPSPISDRVSGRLAPACRGYGDLPSSVRLNAAAFSLTEVVIALGIFAVSMVGVLALFPVASATGRESSEETQAAILAQTVFDDLRTYASALGKSNANVVFGSDTFGQRITNVALNQIGDYVIGYNIKLRDRADSGGGAPQIGPPIALKALSTSPVAAYASVATNSSVTYLSLIRVRPVTNLLGPVTNLPSLTWVSVEVSTPASVILTNRRVYSFTSLVTSP